MSSEGRSSSGACAPELEQPRASDLLEQLQERIVELESYIVFLQGQAPMLREKIDSQTKELAEYKEKNKLLGDTVGFLKNVNTAMNDRIKELQKRKL